MNQLWEVIQVVQTLVMQVESRFNCLEIEEGQLPDPLYEVYSPHDMQELRTKHQTTYKPPSYSPPKPEELVKLGKVNYEVSGLIIIVCEPGHKVPELDTPVFTASGGLFGWINDIFGKIQRPYYSVVKVSTDPGIQGQELFVDTRAKMITEEDISRMKCKQGTDASNKFDQQALQSESSDEEENQPKKRERAERSSDRGKIRQLQNPLKRVFECLEKAGISDQESIKKLTIEQLLKLTNY